MVTFGPAPPVAAHAQRGNPLQPKRDASVEASRSRVPPVPRAPRAVPKAQSAGALTREYRRPGSADPFNRSETRRPREGSPFSTLSGASAGSGSGGFPEQHRRVSSLRREVNLVENQQFEMGPHRPGSAGRRSGDHSRGHVLASETEANRGMPWQPPVESKDVAKSAARRNHLRHEQLDADQALEWVPSAATGRPPSGERGRVRALQREEKEAVGEFLAGAARNASAAGGDGVYGKKNIMSREFTSNQSVDMPQASGHQGAVPSYGRNAKLQRENPVGFAVEQRPIAAA